MDTIKRVLVIDDDVVSFILAEQVLANLNIVDDIKHVMNTESAIEYIRLCENGTLPELILLDIELEDESGFNFLKKYSELEPSITNGFTPKIFMLSSHILSGSNHDLSKRYRTFGVVSQLKKPLETNDLAEEIEEHFN